MTRDDTYVLFDEEHGSGQSTSRSVEFYESHKDEFGRFVEAWAFDTNSDEAVVAGYFRSRNGERTGPFANEPPRPRRAGVVLIDSHGDQMWLGQAGTTGGEGRSGAIRILRDAGFDVGTDGVDSIRLGTHYLDGELAPEPFPRNSQRNNLLHLRGDLCVSPEGAAAKRISAEENVDQSGILDWWDQATGPDSWLEKVTRMMLFSSPETSKQNGYYGYQLIAVGSSGREAWIYFPVPEIYEHQDALAVRQELRHFKPVSQSMDVAIEEIFASAGFGIQLRDERNWAIKKLFPKKRPDTISRP